MPPAQGPPARRRGVRFSADSTCAVTSRDRLDGSADRSRAIGSPTLTRTRPSESQPAGPIDRDRHDAGRGNGSRSRRRRRSAAAGIVRRRGSGPHRRWRRRARPRERRRLDESPHEDRSSRACTGSRVPVHTMTRFRPPTPMSSSFGPKNSRRGRNGQRGHQHERVHPAEVVEAVDRGTRRKSVATFETDAGRCHGRGATRSSARSSSGASSGTG